jgi:hypothetical protein
MEQPKRRGRPPKVKEKINETRDAIIEISLWMPGKEAYKDTVKVKNVNGSLIGAQKLPENYMEIIKRKLK